MRRTRGAAVKVTFGARVITLWVFCLFLGPFLFLDLLLFCVNDLLVVHHNDTCNLVRLLRNSLTAGQYGAFAVY